jgi:glycosyltransferase involved in cell wall biosynthesis
MADPLHVLMVCPQFRPLVGGYEQAAERLGVELIARGHRVTVVTERRDPAWPPSENFQGLEIRRLASWNRPRLQTLSGILFLAIYLLSHARRFDVIHVHQYGWPSTLTILLGRMLGRPVVLKLTNTGPQGIRALLGLLPGTAFHARQHRRLSACIATSERAREEIMELGLAADRVHLIPNGLDTGAFAPVSERARSDARRELGLGDEPLALTVCRMRPEKNLPLLLEAWQRVQTRLPAARLAIVGDGPGMADLKARAEHLGLGAGLLLPGASSDPRPWYAAADLYLLSSTNEGLSNSLMEALSSGLPMVSTRVSGSEDVVAAADVGLLVPLDDAQALAEAAAEMLGAPERARACGMRARAYAEAHFSLVSVADQIEALYGSLVRARPGA